MCTRTELLLQRQEQELASLRDRLAMLEAGPLDSEWASEGSGEAAAGAGAAAAAAGEGGSPALLLPLLVQVRRAQAAGGSALPAAAAAALAEAAALLEAAGGPDAAAAAEAAVRVLHGALRGAAAPLQPPQPPLPLPPPLPQALAAENARLLTALFRSRCTISVYCRVRPLNAAEAAAADAMLAAFARTRTAAAPLRRAPPRQVIEALSPAELAFWSRAHGECRGFAFDRVFGPEASQADVAEEAAPLAAAVLEGHKACILA